MRLSGKNFKQVISIEYFSNCKPLNTFFMESTKKHNGEMMKSTPKGIFFSMTFFRVFGVKSLSKVVIFPSVAGHFLLFPALGKMMLSLKKILL